MMKKGIEIYTFSCDYLLIYNLWMFIFAQKGIFLLGNSPPSRASCLVSVSTAEDEANPEGDNPRHPGDTVTISPDQMSHY